MQCASGRVAAVMDCCHEALSGTFCGQRKLLTGYGYGTPQSNAPAAFGCDGTDSWVVYLLTGQVTSHPPNALHLR